RDEDVDLAVGVLKDLRTRGLVVLLRVGLVLELASQDGILGGLNQLVSLIDRTLHAGGSRGEHELGTKGAQHDAALVRHRLWHREHDLVTRAAPTMASAIPVLPEVASIMVPPGLSSPASSAA